MREWRKRLGVEPRRVVRKTLKYKYVTKQPAIATRNMGGVDAAGGPSLASAFRRYHSSSAGVIPGNTHGLRWTGFC